MFGSITIRDNTSTRTLVLKCALALMPDRKRHHGLRGLHGHCRDDRARIDTTGQECSKRHFTDQVTLDAVPKLMEHTFSPFFDAHVIARLIPQSPVSLNRGSAFF